MVIDGHSHVTLPIENYMKAMDEAGIDKTVLFSNSFHPELAKNAAEVKASMQYLNDLLSGKKGSMTEARIKSIAELVNIISQYPSRFIGFGSVPVGQELNETLQYISEYIQKNKLVGIGEFTLGTGQAHLMDNIFEASSHFNNLPIWIHAFAPLSLQDIREISEKAKAYPSIPVILGHLGGHNWIETMDLVKEIPNLYLDTSAYFSTFVLGVIINEIPDKCIYGVDMPFGDLQSSKEAILKLSKTPSIAAAVLGENIARILKL